MSPDNKAIVRRLFEVWNTGDVDQIDELYSPDYVADYRPYAPLRTGHAAIKAMVQGAMVAEIIAGHRRRFDPASVAAIVFSEPEIVVAGLLPDDATAAGIDAVVSVFPFPANGRALTLEAGEGGGFVRVVSRRDDQQVLGIQAVGRHVAELAGEFAHALAMGAVLDDIAHTIHVHPTLGEAVGEAALLGLGQALHV